MPKTKQQKSEDLVKLSEKLSRAKSVVFADYKGLTMAQLSLLRDQLRTEGAEINITKNSLLNLAFKDSRLKSQVSSLFTGPTATLFAYEDEISPIKALVKALKEANIGQVKHGLLNGEALDTLTILRLASLPSKLELQAKVVGSLASPIYGMVNVLQAYIRNLVYVLDAVKTQRSASMS